MHKFNINNQRLQSKLHLQLVDRPLVLLHLLLYPAITKNAKTGKYLEFYVLKMHFMSRQIH